MGTPQNVIWQGSDKQNEFLAASEFEVLYGGAAGGGKTDGILIDALGLQQGATLNRNYQAILFRRTYPDLKDLIDRSQQLYKDIVHGAKYDKTAHVWSFPSGARIEFGHAQYEADRFKYRGRAFQYIGFEELTLWPTDVFYLYLLSRLRTADPALKCYVRANTNPDGPGAKWVKDRWQININGDAARFDIELIDPETGIKTTRIRRFIPARLSDNPHLAQSGYRQTLMMMSAEDQVALLLGKWEPRPVKGAYYINEMEQAAEEERICSVPHQRGVPVNTFWDIGLNDTTAIVCHQSVALQNRFIDAYENNGEPFDHYTKWLQNTGYTFGTHYLPHDAAHRRLGKEDIRSFQQMLEELMPGHTFQIVPRIADRLIGIQETRNVMPTSVWDKDKCAGLVEALRNYRKKWDEERQVFSDQHEHDWASNYADAFRQFGQMADELGLSRSTSRMRQRPVRSWKTA